MHGKIVCLEQSLSEHWYKVLQEGCPIRSVDTTVTVTGGNIIDLGLGRPGGRGPSFTK